MDCFRKLFHIGRMILFQSSKQVPCFCKSVENFFFIGCQSLHVCLRCYPNTLSHHARHICSVIRSILAPPSTNLAH